MSAVTFIDNDQAFLAYYPDKQIVHHVFRRPISGQPLRDVTNQGVELLKKYKAEKWLSDDRANGPMSESDNDWAMNDWLPRAVAAGWKYWALVVPEDVHGRLSMTDYVNSFYERGIRIMVFTDPDKAMAWLEQQ